MTDQVLIPLPDGRWLALDPQAFAVALAAGSAAVAAPVASATDLVEPLLTAEQLAERTSVPANWFEQAAREERVPHHRLGRYVRFRLSEVAACFSERPTGSGSALAAHKRFRTGT